VHGGGSGGEKGLAPPGVAVAWSGVGAACVGVLGGHRELVVFSSTVEEWCG